ncbi:MAG: hypothetical protein ACUVTR_04285 [Dehalococcoidia bacterium]
MKKIEADYAILAGMGEPSLASNLDSHGRGEVILGLPMGVLTNSSLMFREHVRQPLAGADMVAKLDVANEELFAMVNGLASGLHFDRIKDGVRLFRDMCRGKLALQIMFIEANKDYASEIAALARQVSLHEVQIDTPLQPSKVKPLPRENIASV